MLTFRRFAFVLVLTPVPALGAQQPTSRPAPSRVAVATAGYDSTAFRALQWRLIGPFRGGRANAITGVPSQPFVYYAGYTGGGVWKTENAGASWRNISDAFFRTGSIGAIAVADSDPNVIYVGTGEHAIRGQSSSYGDGVYKSTDAGKTWTRLGLEATKQIAAVKLNATAAHISHSGRTGVSSRRSVAKSSTGGSK